MYSGDEVYGDEITSGPIPEDSPSYPRAAGERGYDPDCPICLRGRRHTDAEHEAALRRARS